MTTPNGYNNPAYCDKFDSSLYDYQYVPEIDPDSPDLHQESNRRQPQTKLVPPKYRREASDSSEFEGSDESNRSIIVEECNNRRVTLICEKRKQTDGEEFFGGGRGAYYQDISLESESGLECQGRRQSDERGCRLRRALDPSEEPVRVIVSPSHGDNARFIHKKSATVRSSHRPERYHRYEEIPNNDDYNDLNIPSEAKPSKSIHRYAEITPDENGYPTLSKEIQIEQSRNLYRQKENLPPKPRAISPVDHPTSFSPPQTPRRTGVPPFSPNAPSPIIYSCSPIKTNSFEMAELSPPRLAEYKWRNDHTFFIQSPKRQPPIGASGGGDGRDMYLSKERCILLKNLQQFSKPTKRCISLPNSPRKRGSSGQVVTPQEKKITQIFQTKYKSTGGGDTKTPARRNISNFFTDQPNDFSPKAASRSPYKSTTAEIPPRTAIITPIFQRKNHQSGTSPGGNFEKMSQAFQSTGNIFRNTKDPVETSGSNQGRLISPSRLKRNQSVPNFSQALTPDCRKPFEPENLKYSRNLDLQYSPKKPLEHVTSIDKSRMSLMDQTSSWSNLDSNNSHCSLCFIFATVVHLVTASATCAISFYLLSKVGRKYYLDFGLLAGFVNFVLGLLGFRSYCWRWIPNRNYVSGFVVLAAFSAFTCGGLSFIITTKPMAGHPILDIMGGAICAVSVLTILLALTGLTMSGCCKAPPPDNRVADV